MISVAGYEGLYSVTSCGRIWSHMNNRWLTQHYDKDGYKRVTLFRNGETKYCGVHRIVLESYNPIENMEELQVNHKSEVKDENWVSNLEWVTPKMNSNYGTRIDRVAKSKSIPVVCVETGVVYPSMREAAEAAKTYTLVIGKVCRKERGYRTGGGFHWEYYNPEKE